MNDYPKHQFEPPTWETAKDILEVYDGSCTELHIIDLPHEQLARIVACLAELPNLEVATFESFSFTDPVPFDATWRERLTNSPLDTMYHGLVSGRGGEQSLQICLHNAALRSRSFDIELIFWNDYTFPDHLAVLELERKLARLVHLAEKLRKGADAARCILTPEQSDNPRLLLKKPGSLVW